MNTLLTTADGSNTLFNTTIGEHYHSKHGALQESKHVFIEAGLKFVSESSKDITLLEVGFGTGLNFILSFAHCEENNIQLNYTGIEAFPLSRDVIQTMNYAPYVPPLIWESFTDNYEAVLSCPVQLSSFCTLEIAACKLQEFESSRFFDLIYFDAFSVRHQPELWDIQCIEKVCSFLKPGGSFVTYAITGDLKRILRSCGFEIQKLPGAPGKREMLRAIKLQD